MDETHPTIPACTTWTPPADGVGMREWQDERCGMCGWRGDLVLDHDHATQKIRGYLCRSCNISEGYADNRWSLWRGDQNVARLMGVDEEYDHIFPGQRIMELRMANHVPNEAVMRLIADAVTR
jgi:hypothetical protein